MAKSQVIQIQPPKLVHKGNESLKVVGMMSVAVVVAVVSSEVRKTSGKKAEMAGFSLDPFLIFAGGAGATVVFVLMTDFGGDVGETLGVGLAGLVLLASVLITGAPLWSALAKHLKGSPTKPLSSAKAPSTPTVSIS
jgi:hypothetical protein